MKFHEPLPQTPPIAELWTAYRRAAAALAWCDAVGYGDELTNGAMPSGMSVPGLGTAEASVYGDAERDYVGGVAAMVAAAAAALAWEVLDHAASWHRGSAESQMPTEAEPEPLTDAERRSVAASNAAADRCAAAAASIRTAADAARAAAAAALGFDAEPADLGLIVASTLWPCTMTDLQTLRRGSSAARRLKVQLRNLDAAKDAATLFHRVEREANEEFSKGDAAPDDPTDGAA